MQISATSLQQVFFENIENPQKEKDIAFKLQRPCQLTIFFELISFLFKLINFLLIFYSEINNANESYLFKKRTCLGAPTFINIIN